MGKFKSSMEEVRIKGQDQSGKSQYQVPRRSKHKSRLGWARLISRAGMGNSDIKVRVGKLKIKGQVRQVEY